MKRHRNIRIHKEVAKFEPFDYGFLLNVEMKMLESMQKYFETANLVIDTPIIRRNLKWGIKLLNIALEKDHAAIVDESKGFHYMGRTKVKLPNEYKLIKYINSRNMHRFGNYEFTASPLAMDDLRVQKAWCLYNRWRYQYLRRCWD